MYAAQPPPGGRPAAGARRGEGWAVVAPAQIGRLFSASLFEFGEIWIAGWLTSYCTCTRSLLASANIFKIVSERFTSWTAS